ncbi:DHA2 family efflux MFS transporter permease subunit [uncultured Lactobacillus sp.]|uniref:DHA2 family efflux MFS transporter permease subunit n=1 Tax=uncultured Lactobacillus sp. TaxID=153152 RepID=UPI00262D61E0|nr:DHA2 family efflux MFS transporter permease subunit [uncultured Lactobacillus sp.]
MQVTNEKIPVKVYAAIIATGLMSFCGVIVETSMNIAFPTLMRDFNVSTNVVQWITSIYLLAVSIIVPISAALKSSYETKSLFLVANILFFLGLVIDALAPAFGVLLLGRVIQGIGTGIALPLMFNIILEQVPQSKVGTMMGVGNMITGIAPALGPTFGGFVLQTLSWRWVFWLLIPLIVFSFVLGLWGIEQKSEIRKVAIDKLSFLAIAIFFIGMIVGFSNLSTVSFMRIALPLIIGFASLGFLIWRSNKLAEPILNLKLFKDPNFAGHILGFFLIQIISLGNAFLLPNFIQVVNGNTALLAGIIVLPAGLAGAIMSPIGGRLLDNFGPRKPILIGASMMILESAIFALFPQLLNNIFIMIVYIIYMAGMGMALGDVMTDTLAGVDEKQTAQGNAILNTVQQFAGAVGTSITSAIVAFSQRQMNSKGPVATRQGTQHAYILLLILAIIIMVLFVKYIGKKTSDK